jgi:sugar transferase EpsL
MKRALELMLAVPALLMLLPLLGAIALAIRLSHGPSVLFRQVRPGKDGRPFEICKFRTMREATGDDARSLSDAERITRFGSFLRSTSLDELPELWNVIRGEMSIVGPRPLLMEYLPLYTEEQARRHSVRPGLTGWSQINGRNAAGWTERLAMDVWYVENRTLALDLRILLVTFWKVVRREGISQEGHVTVERFRGADGSVPGRGVASGGMDAK